jgi:hypothetical protein
VESTAELLNDKIRAARRLLAVCAWALLGWVAIGYTSTIPLIDCWLTATEAGGVGRVAVTGVLCLFALTAFVLWYAAVRYAWLRHPDKGRAPVIWLIAWLIVGNIVAAFFYYFLSVVWRPREAPLK